eukprot:COSAG02_NODE_130_length_34758_cov_80.817767_37_plen_340_part_00
MKIYVHYDEAPAPAHTEVMSFDGGSDVTFELVRVFFVDAYNNKQASARLDGPHQLPVVTDELGGESYSLTASIFDCLNDGDDVFFASGSPASPGGGGATTAAAAASLADQIESLKAEIKRATDDGEYDRLAPLAQQIKALEARQQQAASVPTPAPVVASAPPANPIEASKAAAGDHSHYYWDRQAKGAAPPRPQRVVAPAVAASKIESIRTISKFSMSDEGNWVRLYITHDGVGDLPKGCVTCEYRERSFDLRIDELKASAGAEDDDLEPRYCYRLHAPVLAECVIPSKCKLRVKPKQVVISLRKLNDSQPWQELHKIKGIGETGKIKPDYGDTTTLSS